MRRATYYLLWLFVFSLPWGIVNSVPAIGTISRLLGLATIAVGALTTMAEGRIRRPGIIFWAALVFATAAILSMFWTVSFDFTFERTGTYVQFVGLIWVVRQFARTEEEQHSLFFAFCLGGFVFAFDLLRNFAIGVQTSTEMRYSATGVNPNYVGFTLVIGFPMAWHLFITHRGYVRVVSFIYCLVAPLAILLTAGRASFVGGIIALMIIPLSLRKSFRSFVTVTAVVCVIAAVAVMVVPRTNWERLLTTRQEAEGGMSGRVQIWDGGWRLFQSRPILGVGAGAFLPAIEPILNKPRAAHNTALCLLVEQGVVGFSLFVGVLLACAWVIIGLPSADQKLWAVLLLAWMSSCISGDSQNEKVTWVLFGMLAAQASVKTASQRILEASRGPFKSAAKRPFLRPVTARSMASLPTTARQ